MWWMEKSAFAPWRTSPPNVSNSSSRRCRRLCMAGPSDRSRRARDDEMIIGAEIALLFIGLYALIKGQLPTNKKSKHVVRGWPARVIGIIALLPIPVSFGLGLAVALLFVVQRKQVPGD